MANRNRIAMSHALFRDLIDHVEKTGESFAHQDKARWIKKKDEADIALMAEADIIRLQQITRHVRGVQIEHEGARYFALLGLQNVDQLPEGLSYSDLTPGLFAITVTEAKLVPSAGPLEIRQAVEESHSGEPSFDGIELDEVARLYPEIFIFSADNDYEFTSSLVRVLGALLAASYLDGPIELELKTLQDVQRLFESGSEHIPFENILQGLLSISWGGLFLELYRSVEQLFAVPRLIEITDDWPSSLPFSELANLLENHLSWRPKENDALAAIIRGCRLDVTSALGDAFCPHRKRPVDHQNMADDVYRLRNSLVHFRQSLRLEDTGDQRWNEMIRAMISLVREAYSLHGAKYHLNPVAPA